MNDTIATRILEEDHRVILKVITRMATTADGLDRGKAVEPAVLQEFLEFFQVFVEQAHYEKEESALLAALKKSGAPGSEQSLAMLRDEHNKGRGLRAELAHSVSAYVSPGGAGSKPLAKALRRMAVFYMSHMQTEDYWLLPVADKWLSSKEQEALADQFRRIEAGIGSDLHLHFEKMAQELDCADGPRKFPRGQS